MKKHRAMQLKVSTGTYNKNRNKTLLRLFYSETKNKIK